MMAFISHCFTNWLFSHSRTCPFKWALVWSCLLLVLGGSAFNLSATAHAASVQADQFQLQKTEEGYLLSTRLSIEVSSALEEALLKGVAIFFVMEADVYRERWYWVDKKVSTVQRHLRLSFQPLTKRWRLGVASGAYGVSDSSSQPVYLNQHFDSLDDALSALQRISGWKVAEPNDLEPNTKYRTEFRFRLDVTQLPKPLQLGVIGQNDWALNLAHTYKFVPDQLP